MAYYGGEWAISGFGLAGSPNNWPKPGPAQSDMFKAVLGVK